MNGKSLIACMLVTFSSVILPATAQEKVLPSYIGPIEDIDSAAAESLSSPSSLDSAQALDVSVQSVYRPIIPCRIADTRQIDGAFGSPSGETVPFWGWVFENGGTYIDFGGNDGWCGIPSTATAIHVNFTIVGPKGNGFLRAWPNGETEPNATVVAMDRGFGVSNAATIAICSNGTTGGNFDTECTGTGPEGIVDFWVKIYSDNPEHLVMDVLGYYEALP